MKDCLFCKIISKEIPSSIVYEDDKVLAFNDINPAAPVHILVIPKKHISSVIDIDKYNADIIAHIFIVINDIVKNAGIEEKGFRIVNNCGRDGGQTVGHIHFHILGERIMEWPPG